MTDSLGDRMKGYEKISNRHLIKRVPVMIRVDGRAFHTLTKGLEPFDRNMINTMRLAALATAESIQGCRAVYVQSDEVTFCLVDYTELETQPWFGNDLDKIVSIAAATMTGYFNHYYWDPSETARIGWKPALFDARAFNIPHNEVVNAFLWRAKDWHRNSINMYCSMFFSPKQLHGKSNKDRHDMLHVIGKNWATDLSDRKKNGTFFILDVETGKFNERIDILPTYKDINDALGKLFEYPVMQPTR